jgi:hypothetical protein
MDEEFSCFRYRRACAAGHWLRDCMCPIPQFTLFIFMFTARGGHGVFPADLAKVETICMRLCFQSRWALCVRYILACNQFWRATHKKQAGAQRTTQKVEALCLTPRSLLLGRKLRLSGCADGISIDSLVQDLCDWEIGKRFLLHYSQVLD